MRSHGSLFGSYIPGESIFHRAPLWLKYILLLSAAFPALFMQKLEVSLAVLVFFAIALLLTRIRFSYAFSLSRGLCIVILCLIGYHFFATSWIAGVMLSLNMISCLWATRVLTLTTPGPDLIDGIIKMATPVRFIGLKPERVGLTISIMMRSIPHLLDSFGDVQEACRARGQERNIFAQVMPVVIHAVAYAYATGEALAARGLGDDD
ncbi:MAG: energy-coupling factor transporter transmembrane component T family protein [Propionibacteriaceae bacterium]